MTAPTSSDVAAAAGAAVGPTVGPTVGATVGAAEPTPVSAPEELDALRESVRDFLAAKSDEARVRTVMESETGHDPAVWTQMAEQLGLQSLTLPTRHGGDGYGPVELAVVLEEMGRALLPGPFFATVVLAGSALVAAGDEKAMAAHLPGIAAGTTLAALAVAEDDGLWRTEALNTRATPTGASGWRLTGRKSFVIDGAAADLIVVLAETDSGPALFAVTEAEGVTRTPMTTLDPTRRLAVVAFQDASATAIGTPGQAADVIDRVLDLATTALAAEQVGGARACVEAATAYARERMQFGRPIGSFQAVKHKCADMFARVQVASAAAAEAANALAGVEGAAEAGVAAAVAHAVCSEAYLFAATENIQVHGGIGFTWEHPAHLYFRRAKSDQLLFGGPAVYYDRLLHRAGL